jgi:hypothetical protein
MGADHAPQSNLREGPLRWEFKAQGGSTCPVDSYK